MMTSDNPTLSQIAVRAEFLADDHGHLRIVESAKHRHYKIRLWLDGTPEDTYAVTYILHSSYRDPVREVRDDPRYCLDTTTYGDYDLHVAVRRRKLTEKFEIRLADALAASYPPTSLTPEIAQALEDVRTH